jgi:MFS family permease
MAYPMPPSNWRTPFVVMVCSTLILLISLGVRMTYGLWLEPASTALGWDLEVLSLAIAVQALFWGIATPFSGIVADRYGAGRVVAFAGGVYALGLLLMAQATSPLEAYLGIGFLTGIAMSGCMFPILLAVISRAVPDDRKRAINVGIVSAGGS